MMQRVPLGLPAVFLPENVCDSNILLILKLLNLKYNTIKPIVHV